VIFLLLLLSLLAFSYKRLLRYLQYFQQEEYQGTRFLNWVREKSAYDKRGSAASLPLFAAAATLQSQGALVDVLSGISYLLSAIGFLGLALREEDPRKGGKISLKMTARAKRIFFAALSVSGVALVPMLFLTHRPYAPAFATLAFVQAQPLFLVLGMLLLQPDEHRRQAKFLAEAKANLKRINPYVIAITGSFGKTSTKAILGKLLEFSLGPTFWPPKSINTPMGVTRELRENLKSGHKYAVVEMGAYQRGSISRLCELTPPSAAIVTAVGIMHLERFGSPENVYQAKSELPAHVPACGVLVCNGDNPGSRRMASEFKKHETYLYGLEKELGHLDSFIDRVDISPEGTRFNIHWKGTSFPCQTKMHGRPALSNILAAFTMAAALGAEPANLVAAIASLEPFDNRLEVTRVGPGLQINDAYNSNPDGFLSALEVLKELPGEKRILVTPGMIELGELQSEENERVARQAAEICDSVIVVGEINREAIRRGLNAGGLHASKQFYAANRSEAFQTLAEIRKASDIVLLENDLPDLYEGSVSF